MFQNHRRPTERIVYAFSALCFIGFVGLVQWDAGPNARSASGMFANVTQQRSSGHAVTASVEEAQTLAAARLCRGVMSAARCGMFAATPTTL